MEIYMFETEQQLSGKDTRREWPVWTVLEANNEKTQIKAIKKVVEWLKKDASAEEAAVVIEQLVVPLYFTTNNKSPLKRLLISCLQGLASEYSETIRQCILSQMQEQFQHENRSVNESRHVVDNCASLLDNFVIGEYVIKELCPIALTFLVASFEQFMTECKGLVSPMELSRASYNALVTVQIFNKLLQKSSDSLSVDDRHSVLRETLIRGSDSFINVLRTDSERLDLRSNSAMSTVLVTKVLDSNNAVSKILKCLLIEQDITDAATDPCSCIFPVRKLPQSSFIAWLNATFAMLDFDHLLATVTKEDLKRLHGDSMFALDTETARDGAGDGLKNELDEDGLFVTSVVGRWLFGLLDSLVEVNSKLMASRALVLFTSKISDLLQSQENHPNYPKLCKHMSGDGNVISTLIGYAWEHWEDPTDCIRHQARQIFQNTVTCQLRASKQRAGDSRFLRELCESLLSMGGQQKGRYGPLCCMVEHLGAAAVLGMRPELPSQLLLSMGEQALASYASELFIKMAITHKSEVKEEDDAVKQSWYKNWIDPLLQVLCSGSNLQRRFCIEYILTKLLKQEPTCLKYMIHQLSIDNELEGDKLGALMACLKRAKSLGILHQLTKVSSSPRKAKRSSARKRNITEEVKEPDAYVQLNEGCMWNGVVPINVLRKALSNQNDQMRLDVYGLLCEQQKSTEAVSGTDLALVHSFLATNLNNQEPAFRQSLLAASKKLFMRMRDSTTVMCRDIETLKKQNKDASLLEATITLYKDFLCELCALLVRSAGPDCAFPARTSALSLLNLLTHIFLTDGNEVLLDAATLTTPERVHTLLQCVTDTFENNKIEVFAVLKTLVDHLSTAIIPIEQLEKLHVCAAQLACSTRPQDCTTAAYLLKFLIRLPHSHQIQLQQLTTAGSLECSGNDKLTNSYETRCLLAVQLLVTELKAELATATTSLLHASATRPMYPALHCVRHLLADINFKNMIHSNAWRHLLDDVIVTCFSVAEVVSPVVSHCSPEGNVPEDAIMGPGLAIDSVVEERGSSLSAEDVQGSTSKVNLMPEYLVVCCWRSIKEVSLLLGQLAHTAPLCHHFTAQTEITGLLDMKQVLSMGTYFTRQLLESIHRGAFELAYAGFVKMTERLWNCSIAAAQRLPQQWLETIMADIMADGEQSKLCATRRSAGLPFYIQAVVSTEPAANQRSSLKWLMKQLMPLVVPSTLEGDVENTPQVHALNILRALFRDTRLGEDVTPFIAEGIRAAVLAYASKYWAIRNSATLLFSALVTRTFGVKRSRDDGSKNNCMTGRVFFRKHPQLYEFLIQQISQATQDIGAHGQMTLQPGLYPVLMILSRLLPSVIDDTAAFSMTAFIPHVIKCAGSAVLKTRLMAARAIRPLVAKSDLATTLSRLIDDVTPTPGYVISHNFIHGILLQIDHLLEDLESQPPAILGCIAASVLPKLDQLRQYISRSNRCWLTRKVALQIYFKVIRTNFSEVLHKTPNAAQRSVTVTTLDKSGLAAEETPTSFALHLDEIKGFVFEELEHIFQDKEETVTSSSTMQTSVTSPDPEPGAVEFHKDMAVNYVSFILQNTSLQHNEKENVVLRLLRSSLYEVQLVVLEQICLQLDRSYVSDEMMYSDTVSPLSTSSNVCTMLQESDGIFKELVNIVSSADIYPECVSQCLEVLYLMDDSVYENQHKLSALDVFIAKLFTLIQCSFDSIRNTALQVLGRCLPFANMDALDLRAQTDTNLTDPNTTDEAKTENRDVDAECVDDARVEKESVTEVVVSVLEERCGTRESVESRLACARFLLHNTRSLLLAQPTDNLTGDAVLRAWTVLLRLLQDEHCDVRNTMATFLDASPLHTPLAVMKSLEIFCRHVLPWLPLQALDTLLLWVELDLEPEWDTEDKEVRLFDKGEMNSYRDEVSFINTVSDHLLQLLPSILATTRTTPDNSANQATSGNYEGNLEKESSSEEFGGSELQSSTVTVSTQSDVFVNSKPTIYESNTIQSDIFMITNGVHQLAMSENSNIQGSGGDLAKLELPHTCKEQLLVFISNRFCSVAEELCSRLEWINMPQISDPFLKQSEFQGDYMYILRKLTVLRVLFSVLKNYSELEHPDMPLADVFLLAEKVRDLVSSKFCVDVMNVGQVLQWEIVKFVSH